MFSEYKFVESAIPDVIVANVKIVADLTVNFNYMYKVTKLWRAAICILSTHLGSNNTRRLLHREHHAPHPQGHPLW